MYEQDYKSALSMPNHIITDGDAHLESTGPVMHSLPFSFLDI